MSVSTVNWNQSQVFKLIELFQEREILWNTSKGEYRGRVKVYEAWDGIASAMNLKRGIVKKKMKSLIGQFQRELKKSYFGTAGGSEWYAYKKLKFLKNRIKWGDTIPDAEWKDTETVIFEICEDPEIEKNSHDPRASLTPRTYTRNPVKRKSTINPPFQEKQRQPRSPSSETAQKVDAETKTQFASTAELAGLSDSQAFANFLACKLRQYSRQTRNALQYETSRLLFQADNGYFETPAYGTYPTDLRSNDPFSTCSSSSDNVDYTSKVYEIENGADTELTHCKLENLDD